ncbi:MAG: hypothetical protein H6779_01890 [Candidatus Nomurabacteria bacterium]|nr:hypothetical protein [Candidatus Nomurabacteria bacterium]USN88176.1 MAG: hypothetical protein H6779_01890 [Candidatus Nomurabacteria bacterium]
MTRHTTGGLVSLGVNIANITSVDNIKNALAFMRENRCDLIIVDTKIVEDLSNNRISDISSSGQKIILIIGNYDKNNLANAKNNGVSKCIVKPFQPVTLGEVIDSVFNKTT